MSLISTSRGNHCSTSISVAIKSSSVRAVLQTHKVINALSLHELNTQKTKVLEMREKGFDITVMRRALRDT